MHLKRWTYVVLASQRHFMRTNFISRTFTAFNAHGGAKASRSEFKCSISWRQSWRRFLCPFLEVFSGLRPAAATETATATATKTAVETETAAANTETKTPVRTSIENLRPEGRTAPRSIYKIRAMNSPAHAAQIARTLNARADMRPQCKNAPFSEGRV